MLQGVAVGSVWELLAAVCVKWDKKVSSFCDQSSLLADYCAGRQVWRCVGGLLQAASSTTLTKARATTVEAARACTILGSGAEQCGEPEAARALLQLSGTTCD